MEPQLAYLKSVIEGVPDVEPWTTWIVRNESELQRVVGRTNYLRLKLYRFEAIPQVLTAHGIEFTMSDRYAYLSGVAGRCRDCGGETEDTDWGNAFSSWCPNCRVMSGWET